MRLVSAWTLALASSILGVSCGGSGRAPAGAPTPTGPYAPPQAAESRLDTDAPGAALSVFPRIAASGDHLYVAWYDRRAGDTDVYFNRSLDGGVHWRRTDVRLDTDLPGAASSNVPVIACDGDRVVVLWEDTRGGLSQVRANRSLDAGLTWLGEDVRLDDGTGPDGSSLEVSVAEQGDLVYAAWQDDRNGADDVYFARSTDAGATWSPDRRLDTDVLGVAASRGPRVAASGDRVVVVWQDDRDGAFDVRVNVSSDAGQTWLPADLRLDTDAPGVGDSRGPRIAMDGDRVVVVWQDDRDGAFDVRANASDDAGRTWLPADLRLDTDPPGSADSVHPTLALRGALALVAWEDLRAGLADVHASRSLDGGRTWLSEDVRLDTDGPGLARSLQPVAGLSASRAFVAFADDRRGAFDLLLVGSADQGLTWSAPEVRLDTTPLGSTNALEPDLAPRGTEALVVWSDDRDGPGDVYANRGAP